MPAQGSLSQGRVALSRSVEATLLLEAALLIGGVMGLLVAARPGIGFKNAAEVFARFTLAFAAMHISIRVARIRADQTLLPIVAVITGSGLAILLRLRPETAVLQAQWVLLVSALSSLLLLRLKTYTVLASYRYLFGVLALILVALTLAIGETIGGARAWLDLGPVHFEPSEVGKVLLLLFLAGYLEDTKEMLALPGRPGGPFGLSWPNLSYLGPVLIMWAMAMALLVVQNDLGAAWLLYGLFLGMLYLATGRRTYVGVGLVFAAIGVAVAYQFIWQVKVRFGLWLDPWTEAQGRGYQVVQAIFALGAGGVTGAAPGLARPDLIPAATTDFILAALGEELGYTGVVLTLAAFMLLVGRAIFIALTASDEYGTLLAGGAAVILGLQFFTIAAGVTRILPLTGITVPFMSYGGSAMLTNFALVTILLLVSGGGSRDVRSDA